MRQMIIELTWEDWLEYRRVLDNAKTPEHRKQIEREYDEKYYGIDAEPHDPNDDRVMMAHP